jgi:hypothetical protein
MGPPFYQPRAYIDRVELGQFNEYYVIILHRRVLRVSDCLWRSLSVPRQ